jgi:hypothetical protein
MIAPKRPTSPVDSLRILALGVALLPAIGCGEQPARMAGTIELPKRETARPNVKALAKEIRAKSAAPRRAP